MSRHFPFTFHFLNLVIAELTDLAGQIVTVEQGPATHEVRLTLHFDHATLANVAAQLKDAVLGK